jgi:hypothetical protein
MLKFAVTIADKRQAQYEGSYEILDNGVLKITTKDNDEEYFSPSGWLWVGQK